MATTTETLTVRPGPREGTYRAEDGRVLTPPPGWAWLPPGDAALTRRVKKAGPHWAVKEPKGRKMFTRGVWAPADTIDRLTAEREAEQHDPAYQRRLAQGRKRRAAQQADYVGQFRKAVLAFLAFHPRHTAIAVELAERVSAHATPVGSGTVARTQRISLERRAEAAVIAWMRHHTTAYDRMKVPRIKGRRREIRRKLAEGSRRVFVPYREGEAINPDQCVLQRALAEMRSEEGRPS
ncbi:MAG: DUF2293 domain-containing protein [Myxococcota bacterium]